jgi:hypothetical protein
MTWQWTGSACKLQQFAIAVVPVFCHCKTLAAAAD